MRMASSRASCGGRGGGRDHAGAAPQDEAAGGQRLVQRPGRQVGGHDRARRRPDEHGRFRGRPARRRPGARRCEVHDGLARRDAEPCAASSAVAGRMTRLSRTASSGSRPARRISWVNVISRVARRWTGSSATKLPRPGSRAMRPSSASRCIAFRAVIRLTPNSATSSASDGQARPGRQHRDPLAQGLFDLPVLGLVVRGHAPVLPRRPAG